MKVQGKVAVVTGASSGIGLATAKLLSENGAKVVLAARSASIKSLERDIPNSYAVITDMRQPEDIKNLVKETLRKFGRIDIFVNNAGQGMHGFSVEKTPVEQYKEIMELNVFGVLEAMQEVIPVMRRQGGGTIVNISSRLSKMYIPYLGAYSSTKFALNSLSLTAREELAKENIVVSVVLPGLTATNFSNNSINTHAPWGSGKQMPRADSAEKVADVILKTIETGGGEVLV